MKKLSTAVITTALALSLSTSAFASPLSALKGNCNNSSGTNGKLNIQSIIMGNNANMPSSLQELCDKLGINIKDCIINGGNVTLPDFELPVYPDGNLPDFELPDMNVPSTPDQDQDTNIPPAEDEDNGQDSSQSAFASQVIKLVNEERAKAGLNALKLNTSVAKAAQVRAQEQQQSFSHTRPNGTSCFTALKEAGVSYMKAGENIAYGQTTPQQVMNAWMNSEGHRANILNSDFTEIGVGYYQGSNGVSYWAQMFIR